MPYLEYICAECDAKQNRYHNVRTCKKCGAKSLITVFLWGPYSRATLREENIALRSEVNRLRKASGKRRKYATK